MKEILLIRDHMVSSQISTTFGMGIYQMTNSKLERTI